MREVGQRGAHYQQIDEGLTKAASQYFGSASVVQRVPSAFRRLTIMFTGYMSDGHIVNSLISNFQDFARFIDHPTAQDNFTVRRERSICPAVENPTMIQAIGQFHALTDDDEVQLRRMLVEKAPAEAIRQKAITLVQAISDRPGTNGTVGKRLNTASLLRTDPLMPVAGYVSDIVENALPLLDQVLVRSDGKDMEISAGKISAQSPIVFPKVHRNALCPCGSGKRFRDCHRAP
jgi:hypothetical protein